MKERPILISAPMVRAILNGSKSQTRRIVKPQPTEAMWDSARENLGGDTAKAYPFVHRDFGLGLRRDDGAFSGVGFVQPNLRCPYGKPGDRLWVRETLRCTERDEWIYDADKSLVMLGDHNALEGVAWAHHQERDVCVSIHMPRWASRITLEITGVRVERLNAISEEDAGKEGAGGGACSGCGATHPRQRCIGCFNNFHVDAFQKLWESINGPGSWDANPWVWVVEFKRVEKKTMETTVKAV